MPRTPFFDAIAKPAVVMITTAPSAIHVSAMPVLETFFPDSPPMFRFPDSVSMVSLIELPSSPLSSVRMLFHFHPLLKERTSLPIGLPPSGISGTSSGTVLSSAIVIVCRETEPYVKPQ